MSKHAVEYTRIGKVIRDADGKRESFKSINAAKRWSREWQKSHGGLGIGKLVTATK